MLTWPAFLDASTGSTSQHSHSSALSLKGPSDPVLPVRYVVSANLVTVAIQFCLVSCGNEVKSGIGPGPEGTFNGDPLVWVSMRFRDLKVANHIAVSYYFSKYRKTVSSIALTTFRCLRLTNTQLISSLHYSWQGSKICIQTSSGITKSWLLYFY